MDTMFSIGATHGMTLGITSSLGLGQTIAMKLTTIMIIGYATNMVGITNISIGMTRMAGITTTTY